jgi:hypothetical protein
LEAFEQAGEGVGFGGQVGEESREPVAELGLS